MSREGLVITDPQTHESRFVFYDELDADVLAQVFKPIGGFCFNAEHFTKLKLPKVPFYLEGWLPRMGKAIIYGKAKAGKSYLAAQIARSIGAGIPFLGLPTERGKVLYLQFELGERVLQDRLQLTKQVYENVFVGTTFSMKLDKKAGKEQLQRALDAVRPDVVILDPLIKILSGDENESHDVTIITDYLDFMIETFRCSFLVLHHAGKDGSRGGRGSSALEGWVDAYLELVKISPPNEPLKIRLTPKLLRHANLPPEAIEAEMVDYEFELSTPKVPVMVQVAEFMKGKKAPVSPKQLLSAGIGSQRSVHDSLDAMVRKGWITKLERGSYQWIGGGQGLDKTPDPGV